MTIQKVTKNEKKKNNKGKGTKTKKKIDTKPKNIVLNFE